MEKKLFYKKSPSENKGLSGVVTAVIMIALVMAAAMIVWGIVNTTIKGQIKGAESCFGNYNKVTINSIYTCYDSTNDKFQFSLNIGDIEVDSVLISVSAGGSTNSYTLTNEEQPITGLGPYPSGEGEVSLPGKNAGLTYIASGFPERPDLMKIAPIINDQQCEVSDTLSEIENCF